jgi:hypothetical protein
MCTLPSSSTMKRMSVCSAHLVRADGCSRGATSDAEDSLADSELVDSELADSELADSELASDVLCAHGGRRGAQSLPSQSQEVDVTGSDARSSCPLRARDQSPKSSKQRRPWALPRAVSTGERT